MLTAPAPSKTASRMEALGPPSGRGHASPDLIKALGRAPTRVESEIFSQAWSNHRRRNSLAAPVRYSEGGKTRRFDNLFRETVVEPSVRLKSPHCMTVFGSAAGIVRFTNRFALACQVRASDPSLTARPYGAVSAQVGSVIHDVVATGIGAKPILQSAVFCLCPPGSPEQEGVPDPRRTLGGAVAAVRDYANRMGIPTAGGAAWFDLAYSRHPLIFCESLGWLPLWALRKEGPRPGDLLVAAFGQANQPGLLMDSIAGKCLLNALLLCRERRLFHGVAHGADSGLAASILALARPWGALGNISEDSCPESRFRGCFLRQ